MKPINSLDELQLERHEIVNNNLTYKSVNNNEYRLLLDLLYECCLIKNDLSISILKNKINTKKINEIIKNNKVYILKK